MRLIRENTTINGKYYNKPYQYKSIIYDYINMINTNISFYAAALKKIPFETSKIYINFVQKL